jgi:hypothetical protein
MKIVSKEVCTSHATVPVVNPEETALRPTLTDPVRWFNYVQNYCHSIFVIIPNKALVGIGSVALDNAIIFERAPCRLEIRKQIQGRLNRV